MTPPRGTFWLAADTCAMPAWADIAMTTMDGTVWGACGLWVFALAACAGVLADAGPQQLRLLDVA